MHLFDSDQVAIGRIMTWLPSYPPTFSPVWQRAPILAVYCTAKIGTFSHRRYGVTKEDYFGQRLRELREAKGWTLRKAGQVAGVSHQRIAELERGRARGTGNPTRPSRALVLELAKAYSVPQDSLLELAGYAVDRPELTSDAALLLDLYRGLDDKGKRIILSLAQILSTEL